VRRWSMSTGTRCGEVGCRGRRNGNSSIHEYGLSGEEQERRCGLQTDRVRLPADENRRI